jgi:hypothetical protein
MKIPKCFAFLLILFLIPAYSFSSPLDFMHINLIDGDVQIRTEDTEEWVSASINMPLGDGDRIWVPEAGKLELRLRDGTSLRLDGRSALEVLTLDQNSFQFYLTEGYVYANFSGRRGSFLQMDTPVSSIRVYDRAIFKVDLAGYGHNRISVLKGSVDVESRSGKTTVKSGYTLTLKDETYAELSPLGPPDEWERWNAERDRKLAERRPPPSYLPEELHVYSNDFETYGRWVHLREYGYVWRPTVVVSVGWAPYRIGRWVWVRGDYVWISYEPWGWVPYHYGRWAYVASFGWCWVPPVRGAVFWGPGFVAWVRTPTYVAWAPLGPREIYYGHGHYGPHSVNITKVNVTNVQVNRTIYKNIHVRDAVTVVHHDTFVKGKHVDVKVKENPFLKERIHVGRPEIKPERTTVMPVVKEVPQAKRPPEPIREIRVKELKETRPLVKERNVSVLRPESPPKDMTPKMKEGKPVQRDSEKVRTSRSPQPQIERPRETKPPERGGEKPKESRAPERGVERTREIKPSEGVGRPRGTAPQEKGVQSPRELQQPQRQIETPRATAPQQRGVERQRELKQPERQIQTPRGSKPPQSRIERSRPPTGEKARPSGPGSMERRREGHGVFKQGGNIRRPQW